MKPFTIHRHNLAPSQSWTGLRKACLTLIAALMWCSAPLLSGAEENTRSDTQIEFAVDRALLFDSAVNADDIDVTVINGVAEFEGVVDTLLNRERAVKIARQIRGVRSVVDRLAVAKPEITDEELIINIREALLFDPATESYEIEPTVNDGRVVLTGQVSSWHEKQLASHEVKGLRGVIAVENKLAITYPTERSDREIKADVERALATDIWVDDGLIDVNVTKGRVALSGSVGSAAEVDRANSLGWTTGVSFVDTDNLDVEPWLEIPDERKRPAQASDADIKTAVVTALTIDPRVFSFQPTVTVDNGVVTLSGVVDNLKAKQAAERDALNTVSVKRVDNLLKVRTDELMRDPFVESRITAALARNSITEGRVIGVESDSGVVTLSGTVESALEKSEAEDIAQRTRGVRLVRNQLEVEYPSFTYHNYSYDPFWNYSPYYIGHSTMGSSDRFAIDRSRINGDTALRNRVESELFWSPFVDSGDIDVKVDDRTVTLTGVVDDFSEQLTAIENAYEGGAQFVVNKLSIASAIN